MLGDEKFSNVWLWLIFGVYLGTLDLLLKHIYGGLAEYTGRPFRIHLNDIVQNLSLLNDRPILNLLFLFFFAV